jgi:hypothetical protein
MLLLTPAELVELTARKMPSAQARALRSMGIEHKVRPDGSVAVLRRHVEILFGAAVTDNRSVVREPNWSSVS